MEHENTEQPKIEEKPLDKVDRAEAAVKRMEDLDKSLSEKIKHLEHLQSEKILGGGSEAGTAKEKPKEESPKDYVSRLNKEGWKGLKNGSHSNSN